jgi:pyruvate/2-oxoglutarate/acetoin dehydrogenase E1 component
VSFLAFLANEINLNHQNSIKKIKIFINSSDVVRTGGDVTLIGWGTQVQ